jgi:hypothetical protein
MLALQAYELLSRRADRSIIDIESDVSTNLTGIAAWPLVATAAAALSGQLDDCLTGDDLDDAIRRFLSDHSAGLISQERLEARVAQLLEDLCDCVTADERPLAGAAARSGDKRPVFG